jgi:hypothetical protein
MVPTTAPEHAIRTTRSRSRSPRHEMPFDDTAALRRTTDQLGRRCRTDRCMGRAPGPAICAPPAMKRLQGDRGSSSTASGRALPIRPPAEEGPREVADSCREVASSTLRATNRSHQASGSTQRGDPSSSSLKQSSTWIEHHRTHRLGGQLIRPARHGSAPCRRRTAATSGTAARNGSGCRKRIAA